MIFWKIWFVGVAMAIVIRIFVSKVGANPEFYSPTVRYVMYGFEILGIALVGGIPVAKWIGNFVRCDFTEWHMLVIIIISTAIIFLLVYCIVGVVFGFYNLKEEVERKLIEKKWFIVLVVTSIIWAVPVWKYNENVEVKTETELTQTQERELVFFCGVPLQEISETVSDNVTYSKDEMQIENTILYWYWNEEGKADYDFGLVETTEIIPIEEKETPHLEILSYYTQTTVIDHNTGKKKIKEREEWEKYCFYLPKQLCNTN